jgi:hypothetical protein
VRNGWNTGRRRLAAVGLLVAVTGSVPALSGCSGSDSDAAPPRPSSAGPSASAPSAAVTASGASGASGTPVAGTPVDGERMFQRITAALLKAKGCTMKADIGAVSLSGAFSFDSRDEMGFIAKVYGKGRITANDGRAGSWVAGLGQRFQGAGFYVDDGSTLEGRRWARVPRNTANLTDPQTVIRTHPLYMLVPEAVPLVEPDNIASLISVKKGVVRADEPVRDGLTHYYWSVDGKPPVKGGPKVYEVWLDRQYRPVKFVGQVREAPLQATYGNWQDQKDTRRTPDGKDVADLPID